ncbi:serine/threonine-protein kinase [Nocardioides aromaticivorans]|uniref:non-specific serine/threonine protein kinase n=1 Tax=Nocardioides aromaticivorans TaxID=200618 RepID=A0A7Z0CMJ7_9ACTN|nr:serine/threonine-protein kinase [Nocardioides aromaticivorans]NYI43862.1 serine/threonine-protein kinase [Nocardioides aromaticivorans]
MGALPEPGEVFGRYRVVDRLGHGGMGVVLTAVHEDLGRRVALKLLAPQLVGSPDMVARFRREAQALARLDSPHVVQVYDTGEHDGWLYISTQLIPDGDLTALVEARGPLPPAEALGLVDQVLDGLADAHAVGLVHRDVKPSNVLLRREASGVRAFLCDFGIAQAADVVNTEQTQGVIGTWAYLAPERFDGHPATERTDLYAVGCLLWFLVTGRLPYEGTMVQLAVAHQSAPVPQLPGDDPWSHAVNQLVRRSMAKDPADRFASAPEMQSFLRSVRTVAEAGPAAPTMTSPSVPVGPGRTRESTRDRDAPPPRPPVGPPAPPAPRAPSGPDRGRRSRGRLVGIVLAVLVVVAGTAGALAAAGVFSGDDGDGGGAAGTTTSGMTVGTSPATSPATSPVAEPGPRCWNEPDRVVASLDTCTEPFGLPGLFWAYPELTRSGPCYDAGGAVKRPALWKCNVNLSDGTPVEVNYSLWSQDAGGLPHYREESGDEPETVEVDGRPAYYRWSYYDASKELEKLAVLYIDYRFGFTVYVRKGSDPQQAIDEGKVRFRPPSEMRGVVVE